MTAAPRRVTSSRARGRPFWCLWQLHGLDAAPSLLKQWPAAVPAEGHPGALVAHHNSDDVLHLVRLLGLGDEIAPERNGS